MLTKNIVPNVLQENIICLNTGLDKMGFNYLS